MRDRDGESCVGETREVARALQMSRYRASEPCRNGHEPIRYAKDGKCVGCVKAANARKRQKKIDSDPVLKAAQNRRQREAEERERRKREYEERVAPWHEASKARAEAKRRGDKTYFSPKPCPKGHVAHRYLSGGGCVDCAAEEAASDKKKHYDKLYYRENKERIIERGRAYYEEHKEQQMRRAAEWQERNKDAVSLIKKSYKYRRRAKEQSGASASELRRWERQAKKVCYWCGADCKSGFHIDHYVPLSKGGRHEVDNLVIACMTCNVRKNAKDPYDFARQVGRLF